MPEKNLELITWSSTLTCGIKLIDDQHKQLVDMVNDIVTHVAGNEEQEKRYLSEILQKVARYIKEHFATEEKIMITTKFSGYAVHKNAHEKFTQTVAENIKNFASGKRLSPVFFSRFLKDWILSHIAVMDKQYFEYLRKIATTKADGKLSITSEDVKSL